MKALTTATGSGTGGETERTTLMGEAGVKEGGTIVVDVSTASLLSSVVGSTSSSSRKSVGSESTTKLVLFERLFVVCFVGYLLVFWAMVKCFVFFVFFVTNVLRHGLRGRHIK